MPTGITIRLHGEGALDKDPDYHVGEGGHFTLAALPAGMTSGRTSVAFIFTLPDGKTVLIESSLRALGMAVDALRTAYPEG